MDTNNSNQPVLAVPNFQVEALLKAAFLRTKNRFLSYFLTSILSSLIFGGLFFAAILIGVLLVGVLSTLHNNVLMSVVLIIAGSVAYVGFIYVMVWMQLAMTRVIMQDNMGAFEAIKSVKNDVWGFVWFALLFWLFMIGLFPISIVTLFIILVLWGFWSSFSVFVYLDYHKKGLENLWLSREIINQNFWGVVLRLLLAYAGLYFIVIGLFFVTTQSNIGGLLLYVFMMLAGPFFISYLYEMYRVMKKDVQVKTPTIWVVLSVLGGILLILGIFSIGSTMSKELPNIIKELEKSAPNNKMMPSGYPGMNIDTNSNININGKQAY